MKNLPIGPNGIIPHFGSSLCEKIVQICLKHLLSTDTDSVPPDVFREDERQNDNEDREEEVDEHEEDGQFGLAEPLGSLTLSRKDHFNCMEVISNPNTKQTY